MGDKSNIAAGRYDLAHKLGSGGMAEVYLATLRGAHGFEKQVALKRIAVDLDSDPAFVDRFVAEAKLTVGLTHGHIVNVYDFGHWDESLFMAMEFVDGCDLRRALQEFPADASPGFFFTVAVGMCRGLAHAHKQGVVHRDVSPSNILLSREGDVKIADFGVAVRAHSSETTAAGKDRYAAPEQWRGEATAKSDVFAIGKVLREMGQVALANDPQMLSALEQICSVACELDPAQRTWSAQALADHLEQLGVAQGIAASPQHVAIIVTQICADEAPAPLLFAMARERKTAVERPESKSAAPMRLHAEQGPAGTRLSRAVDAPKAPSRTGGWIALIALVLVGAGGALYDQFFVSRLELLPAVSIQRVETIPSGAEVSVDGDVWGQSPLSLVGDSRLQFALVASMPGYRPAQTTATMTQPISLELQVASTRVTIDSSPQGAVVEIDGKGVGETPLTIEHEPGEFMLRVSRPGYADVTDTVAFSQTPFERTVTLRKQAPRAKPTGFVLLTPVVRYDGREAWGHVYFRGKRIGRAPTRKAQPLELPTGTHRLRIQNPHSKDTGYVRVTVQPGKRLPKAIPVRLAKVQ